MHKTSRTDELVAELVDLLHLDHGTHSLKIKVTVEEHRTVELLDDAKQTKKAKPKRVRKCTSQRGRTGLRKPRCTCGDCGYCSRRLANAKYRLSHGQLAVPSVAPEVVATPAAAVAPDQPATKRGPGRPKKSPTKCAHCPKPVHRALLCKECYTAYKKEGEQAKAKLLGEMSPATP
jgi:hypothetical protein